MPANIGSTLHEQTARMPPDAAATEYATFFGDRGPRCFITAACDRKVVIAPAMKMAGTTQASVWLRAYHWRSLNASRIAFDTFGFDSGRQYATRNTPSIAAKIFSSRFMSRRSSGTMEVPRQQAQAGAPSGSGSSTPSMHEKKPRTHGARSR